MNELPTKLIVKVVPYLSIPDKHNLACANKKLYGILTETVAENTLYSTLVFKNIKQFNQAMELR